MDDFEGTPAADGGGGPVLPMFTQMNVRWEGSDTAWREASRYNSLASKDFLKLWNRKITSICFLSVHLCYGFIQLFRWVRFEEDVEDSGNRWSKPYVPSIPLAAFMDFRQCFTNGIIALDVPGSNMQVGFKTSYFFL